MLIIIPAYNEEQNIGMVVDRAAYWGKVVVIDDGSHDRTAEIAAKAGAEVIRQRNQGYCAALRTGYLYAIVKGYCVLVQMDGDGQHDTWYIPSLALPVAMRDADITIGSRFYYDYPMEFKKLVGVMFFRRMIQRATGQTITDPTSGFQCLNRTAILFMLNALHDCTYPDANVIIKAIKAGLRVKEVPVQMQPNPQGRSMHRGGRKIAQYMAQVMGGIFREVRNG